MLDSRAIGGATMLITMTIISKSAMSMPAAYENARCAMQDITTSALSISDARAASALLFDFFRRFVDMD